MVDRVGGQFEQDEAGCADKLGRYLLIFVSGDRLVAAFFDIVMTLKRYVGGLAVSTDECLHIWFLGLRSDDGINSFTVCRLRFLCRNQDTNSLFRSSSPGRLDWHPFGMSVMCRGSNVMDKQ